MSDTLTLEQRRILTQVRARGGGEFPVSCRNDVEHLAKLGLITFTQRSNPLNNWLIVRPNS